MDGVDVDELLIPAEDLYYEGGHVSEGAVFKEKEESKVQKYWFTELDTGV